jgi:hypothetical protein
MFADVHPMPKTNSQFDRETIQFLVQTEARRLRRFRLLLNLRWIWIAAALWVALGVRQSFVPTYLPDTYGSVDGQTDVFEYPRSARRVPWIGMALLICSAWPLFEVLRHARADVSAAELTITGLDSPAAVGPLTSWLGSSDKIARGLAETRLLALLPTMKPRDSSALTDLDHARLNRIFSSQNSELALAVLAAWEQIGDERDVLAVQYVSEGLDIGRADARVREAAVSCLPFLTERAEKRKRAATLLRPSGGTSSDGLLRPASDASSKKVQALLRPHGDRQPDGT